MSTYVIGDVHGCYNELKALLTHLEFNSNYDKVIFVGDLIGRGPKPVEVLDLVMDLESINVFGNHDIKFLAMAHEVIPFPSKDMQSLFESPRLDKYITWLSSSKLMYIDENFQIIVTHAGIPPSWNVLTSAKEHVNFFENYLMTQGIKKTMQTIYANSVESLSWHNHMKEEEIIQYIIFGFTKMKYCYENGVFDTQYQCSPGQQPSYLKPWFILRNEERNNNYKIIFGHWAALGLYQGKFVTCCDTGCVWGGKLTAIKIEPNWEIYQIDSNYNANKYLF